MLDKNTQSVLEQMWVHSLTSLNFFIAKINETDTFGPGDDDEIQFDDIGDDDEDIDDVSSECVFLSYAWSCHLLAVSCCQFYSKDHTGVQGSFAPQGLPEEGVWCMDVPAFCPLLSYSHSRADLQAHGTLGVKHKWRAVWRCLKENQLFATLPPRPPQFLCRFNSITVSSELQK